jgi:hypothetical protein
LLLLSANTITTVSNTATAAPTPSVLAATTNASFFAAVTASFLFPQPTVNVFAAATATNASVSVANALLLKLTEVQ